MNRQLQHPLRPKMTKAEFVRIATFAMQEAGLSYAPSKRSLVESRLTKRLLKRKLHSFSAYCDVLDRPDETQERQAAISLLTTNVTSFFREAHHFEHLKNVVLPALRPGLERGTPVRLWSAGCSSGQEAYSLAMTIATAWPDVMDHDVRVLATDIDPGVLRKAKAGIYEERELGGIPEAELKQFTQACNQGGRKMRNDLQQLIRFKELNLLHDWPMTGMFDVVLCRNVVIYFDEATQRRLWRRFGNVIKPNGWLYLGHSERLCDSSPFEGRDQTTYRRISVPVIQGEL